MCSSRQSFSKISKSEEIPVVSTQETTYAPPHMLIIHPTITHVFRRVRDSIPMYGYEMKLHSWKGTRS
jgi:hypothetical protein